MANTSLTVKLNPNGTLGTTQPMVTSPFSLTPSTLPKGNIGTIGSNGQLQPNKNPIVSSNAGATSPAPAAITPPATTTTSIQTPAAKNYIQSLSSNTGSSSGSVSGNMLSDQSIPNPLTSNQPSQPSPTDLAFAEYIKALAPSQDVTNAETTYNDYTANQSKSVAGLEGQGRGIPLTLVRGQQEKLLKQTQPEALRLQNAVGIAQNNASLTQNAAKAAFDYQSAKYKPTEIGGALAKLNPATGKYETVYSAPQRPADQPASVQEYEYAKSQGYTGTFQQYQNEDANRKAVASGTGLTPGQINTTVNQIRGSFDNEPIVKQYNTIATTVNALKDAGTSPTDDIQRVYAFAKIMDPNSAVREGEYKTVQDYATSLLQRAGIKANRVFNNSGFLTDEARKFMLGTLNNVLTSNKKAYDNVASEYQRQIDDAYAGKPQSITNYGQAFDTQPTEGDPLGLGFNQGGSGPNNAQSSIKLGSPLAVANNNPGNLRYAGQSGATPGKGGFAKFATPEAGVKALQNQINLDASRGLTLGQFINKYAPPSENNTSQYLTQAINNLKVSANTPLKSIDLNKITKFMALKESSSTIG